MKVIKQFSQFSAIKNQIFKSPYATLTGGLTESMSLNQGKVNDLAEKINSIKANKSKPLGECNVNLESTENNETEKKITNVQKLMLTKGAEKYQDYLANISKNQTNFANIVKKEPGIKNQIPGGESTTPVSELIKNLMGQIEERGGIKKYVIELTETSIENLKKDLKKAQKNDNTDLEASLKKSLKKQNKILAALGDSLTFDTKTTSLIISVASLYDNCELLQQDKKKLISELDALDPKDPNDKILKQKLENKINETTKDYSVKIQELFDSLKGLFPDVDIDISNLFEKNFFPSLMRNISKVYDKTSKINMSNKFIYLIILMGGLVISDIWRKSISEVGTFVRETTKKRVFDPIVTNFVSPLIVKVQPHFDTALDYVRPARVTESLKKELEGGKIILNDILNKSLPTLMSSSENEIFARKNEVELLKQKGEELFNEINSSLKKIPENPPYRKDDGVKEIEQWKQDKKIIEHQFLEIIKILAEYDKLKACYSAFDEIGKKIKKSETILKASQENNEQIPPNLHTYIGKTIIQKFEIKYMHHQQKSTDLITLENDIKKLQIDCNNIEILENINHTAIIHKNEVLVEIQKLEKKTLDNPDKIKLLDLEKEFTNNFNKYMQATTEDNNLSPLRELVKTFIETKEKLKLMNRELR